ncbi:MAG: hypothetical protein AB7L17_16135 [Ilumatobacteraceae bacterium]
MTIRTLATAVCVALLAAACSSGGNEVVPVSFPTAPTVVLASPATTEPVAPTGQPVAEPETTLPATTLDPVTTTDGVTGPTFSDALGVKVDTAPGVRTPGDTRQLLPEGLYVHIAWQGAPDDPSVFTAREEDVEILEAYANASLAYYRAFLTTRTTDAPEFDQYFVDGGAKYDSNFEQARAGGYIGSLGSGVVLRPYILHDETTPTSAIILDCYLQNETYVAPGDLAELGELIPSGATATMTRVGTRWMVDIMAGEPAACL